MATTIDLETREVLDLVRLEPECDMILSALESPEAFTRRGRINKTGLGRALGVPPSLAAEWLAYAQATTRRLAGDLDADPVRPLGGLITITA